MADNRSRQTNHEQYLRKKRKTGVESSFTRSPRGPSTLTALVGAFVATSAIAVVILRSSRRRRSENRSPESEERGSIADHGSSIPVAEETAGEIVFAGQEGQDGVIMETNDLPPIVESNSAMDVNEENRPSFPIIDSLSSLISGLPPIRVGPGSPLAFHTAPNSPTPSMKSAIYGTPVFQDSEQDLDKFVIHAPKDDDMAQQESSQLAEEVNPMDHTSDCGSVASFGSSAGTGGSRSRKKRAWSKRKPTTPAQSAAMDCQSWDVSKDIRNFVLKSQESMGKAESLNAEIVSNGSSRLPPRPSILKAKDDPTASRASSVDSSSRELSLGNWRRSAGRLELSGSFAGSSTNENGGGGDDEVQSRAVTAVDTNSESMEGSGFTFGVGARAMLDRVKAAKERLEREHRRVTAGMAVQVL